MRDQIEAHLWAESGPALFAGIDRAIANARIAFERLTARQFAAPWAGRTTTCTGR